MVWSYKKIINDLEGAAADTVTANLKSSFE